MAQHQRRSVAAGQVADGATGVGDEAFLELRHRATYWESVSIWARCRRPL